MSVLMNASNEHESYWSLRLLLLLQDMASQNTNAVLKILENVDHLQTECRYPESGLLFAGKRWRAFYHCHEATTMHPNEHGHFHIFTDIGNQSWAHVAGLSIDAEGQPLQWFMVNRWVTDGPWFDRKNFLHQLKYIAMNKDDGLVVNWLAALLQLYRDGLFNLLKNRDEKILQNLKGHSREEIHDDRDIYLLAEQSIDLQSRLKKHLLQNQANATETIFNKVNVR